MIFPKGNLKEHTFNTRERFAAASLCTSPTARRFNRYVDRGENGGPPRVGNHRIGDGSLLTFWYWCGLGLTLDKAVVEISTDGSDWIQLDTLASTSGLWVEKQISLSGYAGDHYLRWRLFADMVWEEAGLYLDDVSICPASK